MTHLGAEVAAYVDGQLSPERAEAVRRHLDGCERCRVRAAEQEQVKRRMALGRPAPVVPAHLVAALAAVPAAPPSPAGSRAGRAGAVASAILGSSAAVLVLAYLLAPPVDDTPGDPVRPDYDAYAASFVSDADSRRSSETALTASVSSPEAEVTLTGEDLEELAAAGWPCDEYLAVDLARVDGRFVEDGAAVALHYSGDNAQLHLIEQVGSLDTAALDGFDREALAGSEVWVREGQPTVVTWQADGVVYTVVTNASLHRVAEVLEELPSTPARSVVGRIEDGLHRMSSWASAA
ncbi:MAG: zf-HC2 domain-containing protein [Aeromicrobium sp.]|uniref:anti-sigma factor family protein n=1 Tax=Aeromicrobium sp. TaxID=1871063 RepID=UPI0039E3FBF7